MRASCKQPVRVNVRLLIAGSARERPVAGFYHPRGCLGARRSHLDLEPDKILQPLVELTRQHGTRLTCRNHDGCVETHITELGGNMLIRVPGSELRWQQHKIYAMTTRSGMIYIAPLELKQLQRSRTRGI